MDIEVTLDLSIGPVPYRFDPERIKYTKPALHCCEVFFEDFEGIPIKESHEELLRRIRERNKPKGR